MPPPNLILMGTLRTCVLMFALYSISKLDEKGADLHDMVQVAGLTLLRACTWGTQRRGGRLAGRLCWWLTKQRMITFVCTLQCWLQFNASYRLFRDRTLESSVC
jgi:hypothetical protein